MSDRVYEVKCDICGKNTALRVYEETVKQGTLRYFTCTHCETRFNVGIVTPRAVKLKQQLDAMARLGKTGTPYYKKRSQLLASAVIAPDEKIIPGPDAFRFRSEESTPDSTSQDSDEHKAPAAPDE